MTEVHTNLSYFPGLSHTLKGSALHVISQWILTVFVAHCLGLLQHVSFPQAVPHGGHTHTHTSIQAQYVLFHRDYTSCSRKLSPMHFYEHDMRRNTRCSECMSSLDDNSQNKNLVDAPEIRGLYAKYNLTPLIQEGVELKAI